LEGNGVSLKARDLIQSPLRRSELDNILGNHDPKYYLDMTSPSYEQLKLDSSLPPRNELLAMIESHPDLLRHPIIFYGRLMTIGANRRQLITMFHLTVSENGAEEREQETAPGNR
jgi:regulatory protein spx